MQRGGRLRLVLIWAALAVLSPLAWFAPSSPAAAQTTSTTTTYVVQSGDCCWSRLATKFGISMSALLAMNNATTATPVIVGKSIIVPNTGIVPPPPPPSGGSGACIPSGVYSYPSKWDPQHRWRVAKPNQYQLHVWYQQSGPKGAVVAVGGSLMYGVAEVLTRDLVASGYGPVCVDARIGRQMNALSTGQGGLNITKRLKAAYPGSNVRWYISLGNNDINSVSITTAINRIQPILDVVAPTTHPLIWSNLASCRTAEYRAKEAAFNVALSNRALAVHDWAAIIRAQPNLLISDCLHVYMAGNLARSASVVSLMNAT